MNKVLQIVSPMLLLFSSFSVLNQTEGVIDILKAEVATGLLVCYYIIKIIIVIGGK